MTNRMKRVAVSAVLVGSAAGLTGCGLFHDGSSAPVARPTPTVTTPGTVATPPRPSQTPTPVPAVTRIPYLVRPGDWMGGIAQADGITAKALEAFNPQIADPHWIYPGQTLYLPQPLLMTPPTLPVATPCDGNLAVTEGQPQGAAGTIALTFDVTNKSNQACTVEGYPAVRLLDANGTPLAVRSIDGQGQATDSPVTPVTLAPGAAAQFRIAWTDVTWQPGLCPASGLASVALPGQRTTTRVQLPAPAEPCPMGSSAVPVFHIGPVTPLGE